MRLISLALALSLTTSAALAGTSVPLSPGAPAGVKKAQLDLGKDTLFYIGVGVAAAIGLAIASGNDHAATPAPPVTTS
jgi:hypothetical protein